MSLAEGRIYLDANILIYAAEHRGDAGDAARRWFVEIARGRRLAVTSELTLVEVLPHPIAIRDAILVDGYARLLTDRPAFRVPPVTRAVLRRAAGLRAELGIGTPDAIHVATAIDAECSAFLTNDDRLRLPSTLRRLTLSDAV